MKAPLALIFFSVCAVAAEPVIPRVVVPLTTLTSTPLPVTSLADSTRMMRGSELAASMDPMIAKLYPANALAYQGRMLQKALRAQGDTPENVAAAKAWIARQ